jgi:hypothetical protein
LWASWIEVADLETDRLLAERGWLARNTWSGLSGVVGLTLLELAIVPSVASWIRERVEA